MQNKRIPFLIGLLAILLTTAIPAHAHLEGGKTKDIGQYRIQFVSEPKFPVQNERVVLLFNIQNSTNEVHLSNQIASIAIMKDGNMIEKFPKYNATYGDIALNYTFSSTGLYTASMEVLSAPMPVKADFPVEVSSGNTSLYIIAMIGTGAITIIIVAVFMKKKIKREQETA